MSTHANKKICGEKSVKTYGPIVVVSSISERCDIHQSLHTLENSVVRFAVQPRWEYLTATLIQPNPTSYHQQCVAISKIQWTRVILTSDFPAQNGNISNSCEGNISSIFEVSTSFCSGLVALNGTNKQTDGQHHRVIRPHTGRGPYKNSRCFRVCAGLSTSCCN